jgi:hypothetical protein
MAVHPWLSPALFMTLFKKETMLVHPVVIPGLGTRSILVAYSGVTNQAYHPAGLAARTRFLLAVMITKVIGPYRGPVLTS